MKVFVALALLGLIGYSAPHSWIACSDYMEKNGADWNPDLCRGFSRSASNFAQKNSFGQDRGFDYKPGSNGPGCKTTYSQGGYSSEYPKAIYFLNQQVILAHPMKNHGADAACTNLYIPDNGNAIYRGRVNRDRDESFSFYKQRLVTDLGVSPVGQANTQSSTYPKPGYQNAPNFCKNTDKAMGTYSFNVPSSLAPGDYTFMWRWSFNGPQDIYTTCFDVVIVRTKAERDQRLRNANQNNFYVACGGTTSNGGGGSSAGCGGSGPTVGPTTMSTTTTTPATTRSNAATTSTRPTTTTGAPGSSRRVPVMAYQITGEISLGSPRNGISKRYVSVHFECSVDVNFWNARLLSSNNHQNRKKRHADHHYDLLQELPLHVSSGKIYFAATFEEPCNIITDPPIATITMEK